MLIGVQLMNDMRHFKVTVNFDEPVNVTPTFMFAALRGDGNPQMVLRRA